MAKVSSTADGKLYLIFCPGCECGHQFDERWTFNGNIEKPTFRASMLVRGTVPVTDEEVARIMAGEKITPKPLVCHSYVTDGKIQFLDDCTHELRGQTVDLPEFDHLTLLPISLTIFQWKALVSALHKDAQTQHQLGRLAWMTVGQIEGAIADYESEKKRNDGSGEIPARESEVVQ
jgi:hypothetical protein